MSLCYSRRLSARGHVALMRLFRLLASRAWPSTAMRSTIASQINRHHWWRQSRRSLPAVVSFVFQPYKALSREVRNKSNSMFKMNSAIVIKIRLTYSPHLRVIKAHISLLNQSRYPRRHRRRHSSFQTSVASWISFCRSKNGPTTGPLLVQPQGWVIKQQSSRHLAIIRELST